MDCDVDYPDQYKSFVEFLCNFIKTVKQVIKVVLLMDISDTRNVKKLNDMSDLISNLQDSKVIVLATLTSGKGSNVLGKI